jgi:hypothetical protein
LNVHNDAMDEKSDGPKAERPRRSFGKIGGAAIGSAMAGVDGAVFRNLPPPHEVVAQSRYRGPVATGDGKAIIVLPDEVPEADE